MTWFLLALLATVAFTVVNFIDKVVVAKALQDYLALPVFSAWIAGAWGVVFWVGLGLPMLPWRDTALILFIGWLTVCSWLPYFRSMKIEDTSTVIVLLQIQPVLVLILGWVFLDERINLAQFIGFVLILCAAVGVSLAATGEKRVLFSPALPLITLTNLGISVVTILFKFLSTENDFWTLIAYENLGTGIGGVFLVVVVPSMRRAAVSGLHSLSRKTKIAILLNEGGLVVVAKILMLSAVALGPVALVKVVMTTQVFIGILTGWLLTLFFSARYHEDISRRALTRKLAFAALMFVGVAIISSG